MKVDPAIHITMGLLGSAMLMAVVRLIRGPSAADRIIALDLLAIVIVAVITTSTMLFDEPIYLDVAISLAVIAFIGTVAFSRLFLQGRLTKKDREGTE